MGILERFDLGLRPLFGAALFIPMARGLNNPELIRRVAEANPHLTPIDAKLIVATIFK